MLVASSCSWLIRIVCKHLRPGSMTISFTQHKQLLRSRVKVRFSDGMQSTNRRPHSFKPLPPRSTFIQLLHVNDSHWVTTMNVVCDSNAVRIYDSMGSYRAPSLGVQKQICSFLKPKSDSLIFDMMNVQSHAAKWF